MMWWTTRRTTCSEADRLRRWSRNSGPRSRSNGRVGPLGKLLLDLAIAQTCDVFDQDPFILALDELARREETDHRFFIDDCECRAQCVLLGHDTPKRPTESIDLQLRADRRSAADMIGGAVRRELMRVPEQLLLMREPLFAF